MKISTGLLLSLLLIASSGCSLTKKKEVAYNEPQAYRPKGPQYAQTDSANVPRSIKDIKQPAQLFLAYGAWETQLGHYEEARTAYKKALEKDPDSIEAHLGLAELLDLEGKSDQAERAFQQLVTKYPDSQQLRSKFGRYYVAHRRFPEALAQFQAGHQIDPTVKEANFELGVTLAELGRHEEGIGYMSHSVGQTAAYLNVAYILKRQGQPELASRFLAQARQADPAGYQAAILQASHAEEAANPTSTQHKPVQFKTVPMTVETHAPTVPANPVIPLGIETSR